MQEDKKIFFINIFLISVVLLQVFLGISIIFKKNLAKFIANKRVNTQPIFQQKANEIDVFYEKIPGSKFHGPDATWWGYNQNKIVRFGNMVFMYVVENIDDKNTTLSQFVIYKKEGDTVWEKGASFPTSRPGNILIDSQGVLHAFVFEPVDVLKNDSWGKLIHYWFENAGAGDIQNYNKEIVIDNNGTNETVNIRVGAAIGPDDTLAVAFGMGRFNNLYKDFSEHLYIKKPTDKTWTHHIAGEELDHEYYYPFVWIAKNEFYLLPVQDDYNGQGTPQLPYPNIYQKILLLSYKNGIWSKELIADLSSHPLAKSRPRLLEQEELYQDTKGTLHMLYKEFLDEKTSWGSNHVHVVKNAQGVFREAIPQEKDNSNWIRMFEVDGSLYYLYVYYDSAYIKNAKTNTRIQIPLPPSAHGMYPYIATIRGGTRETESYIDMLFLAADQYDYRDGTNVNYYVRIAKSEFAKLR